MLLGAIVAVPALRLGGLALALATLALGFVGDNVLFQWSWLAGPLQQGWAIPRPSFGPIDLSSNKSLAVLLVVIVLLVTLLIRNLQRSSSGRMMSAVRTSQSAAETSGISGTTVKITIFAVSAALAGLGGVLLVTVDQHVSNSTYSTPVGLVWLATVVLWGIRRPSAAIAAGMTSVLLVGVLSSGFHFSFISWSGTTSVFFPSVLFGLGAVTMAKNPDGILSLAEEQTFRRKQRRAAKLQAAAPVPRLAALDGLRPDPAHAVANGARVPTPVLSRGSHAGVAPRFGVRLLRRDPGALRHRPRGACRQAHGAGGGQWCGQVDPVQGGGGPDGTEPRRDHPGGQGRDQAAGPSAGQRSLLAPESSGIFPGLSVEDNLLLLLPEAADRNRAYERFPILGERRRLAAGNLSGGEQQMLTMAPFMINLPSF